MNHFRLRPSLLIFVAIIPILGSISLSQSPAAHLMVTSVRQDAGERTTSNLRGTSEKWIVRFRLETSADQGVYLLLLGPKGSAPLGYALERVAGHVVWRDGEIAPAVSKSPGIAKLANQPGAHWILLPSMAAYEWEVATESAGTQVDQSRSVFIKRDMKSAPVELAAPWFSVHQKQVAVE